MKNAIEMPAPIGSVLLLAACLAVSACDRTDPPSGTAAPAAREAASQADAIAVPPALQASEPAAASEPASEPAAASQPQSSASPAPSTAVAIPADTVTAAASAPAQGSASAAEGDAGASGKLYQVVEGYKVDAATMEGFRTWRAAACDRCHGANQEGMVGPSLIESLKVRDKAYFVDTLTNGRLAKGMPSFKTSTTVMENMDELYAYLKGRSDGAITRAKVEPMN